MDLMTLTSTWEFPAVTMGVAMAVGLPLMVWDGNQGSGFGRGLFTIIVGFMASVFFPTIAHGVDMPGETLTGFFGGAVGGLVVGLAGAALILRRAHQANR